MPSGAATAVSAIKTTLALLAALLLLATPARADEGGAEDFDATTGYRIARYRSPVPASVPGATRVGPDEIDALVKDRHAILLDVMPSNGAGLIRKTGTWATEIHDTIPGSVWLPDVGRGRIDTALEAYLRDNLKRLTGNNPGQPIMVFCQSDCWMGWNAVQRIAALGYTSLYWYPDGVDGWRDWDRPLIPAVPVNATPD